MLNNIKSIYIKLITMPVFTDIPRQIFQPGESPEERHKLIHTAAWTIFACLHETPRWILKTKINLISTNCGYPHHLSKRRLDRNPKQHRLPMLRAAEFWPQKVKIWTVKKIAGARLTVSLEEIGVVLHKIQCALIKKKKPLKYWV